MKLLLAVVLCLRATSSHRIRNIVQSPLSFTGGEEQLRQRLTNRTSIVLDGGQLLAVVGFLLLCVIGCLVWACVYRKSKDSDRETLSNAMGDDPTAGSLEGDAGREHIVNDLSETTQSNSRGKAVEEADSEAAPEKVVEEAITATILADNASAATGETGEAPTHDEVGDVERDAAGPGASLDPPYVPNREEPSELQEAARALLGTVAKGENAVLINAAIASGEAAGVDDASYAIARQALETCKAAGAAGGKAKLQRKRSNLNASRLAKEVKQVTVAFMQLACASQDEAIVEAALASGEAAGLDEVEFSEARAVLSKLRAVGKG